MEGPNRREENQVGKEGRPKLKGKKSKWGRSERGEGKVIKNKSERKKKAKKGRKRGGKEEKGRYDSTEKIAK